jgi:hypothetical protein
MQKKEKFCRGWGTGDGNRYYRCAKYGLGRASREVEVEVLGFLTGHSVSSIWNIQD